MTNRNELDGFGQHLARANKLEIDDQARLNDFEQQLVVMIGEQVKLACNVNTRKVYRQPALQWIFASNTPNALGVTLDLAARAAGSSAAVIQSRVHRALCDANIRLASCVFGDFDPLPDHFRAEAIAIAGREGANVAETVWGRPGIRAVVLLQAAKDHFGYSATQTEKLLERFESAEFLAQKGGRWFHIRLMSL